MSLLVVSGCKSHQSTNFGPPFSSFRAPELPHGVVRRVALVPLDNMTNMSDVHLEFTRVLAGELNTAGMFDIVSIPWQEISNPILSPPATGRYDERFLAQLGRKYGVDAAILGRVSQYHPYWPPRIGVVLHMVDVRDGRVLASVDGIWDSRNKYIAHQAEQFYNHLYPQTTLPHSELMLHSPSYFEKFVAYQIAERLSSSRMHAFSDVVVEDAESGQAIPIDAIERNAPVVRDAAIESNSKKVQTERPASQRRKRLTIPSFPSPFRTNESDS